LPDPSAIVFGTGLFFTVLYLFLPLMGLARVSGQEAKVVSHKLRWDRSEAEFKRKEKPNEEEKAAHKTAREEFERRKARLEEDAESAEESRRQSTYWHRWGMLFGVLLLCFGSLGFLSPKQPPTRRVLWTAVLLAVTVGVIGSLTGFGLQLSIGPR
jgi:hypothetical protein